jgi:SP family myo-inositol transporter-like MFS transporter 13
MLKRHNLTQVLRTATARRALILGCLLQFYQQLAGINTVMYYSAKIISMAGVSDDTTAIWLSAAVASVNFLCTFIGLYFVERVGRRKLLLASLIGATASLAILAVGFQVSVGGTRRG